MKEFYSLFIASCIAGVSVVVLYIPLRLFIERVLYYHSKSKFLDNIIHIIFSTVYIGLTTTLALYVIKTKL